MRNFLPAISSVILLIALGLGFEAQAAAKVVGQVVKVDGHAFLIRSGNVVEISKGTYIQDFDEVLTEDNAEIMVGDFSRRQLTMAGGGHLKWMNKLIELKRGYVWVQSLNPAELFVIQTANTQSTISSGELVVSFDVSTLKSQVLTLGGKAIVKSLLAGAEYELKQGEFSMVHKDFEQGQPRVPTPVGMDSMKKMKQLFTLAKPLGRYDDKTFLEHQEEASRSLASTDDVHYEVPAAVNPKNLEDPVVPDTKHHAPVGAHGDEHTQASLHHEDQSHDTHHEASAKVESHDTHHEASAKVESHDTHHEASAKVESHDIHHEDSAKVESHDIHHEDNAKVESHDTHHEASAKVESHDTHHGEPAVPVAPDAHGHAVEEHKTAGAPVPGEIHVIRKEILPEKQPDAFKLEALYNKELKEIEKEKALRQQKNRPKPIPVKVRIFGQSAAASLRGPASVYSLQPSSPTSDPLLNKLKTQLKISDERNDLMNKLRSVQSSPGPSEE